MNLPKASPNENMQTPASINAMPARRADRPPVVVVEIFESKLIDRRTPHPALRNGLYAVLF
jgi:hypothetical protein